MGTLRGSIKILLFLMLVIVVIPTQGLVLLITKGPASYIIPRWWHKAVSMVFGIRYEIVGTPNQNHQTLYMSNHLSYLDISMIGGILNCSFVAKSEVAGWSLFGFLSKLQQTAFIQRKASEARSVKSQLQNRIAAGESLIIFPEGTSTSGFEVLPFKSSLFSLAMSEEAKDVYVQPMTISLLEVDGHKPRSKDEQNIYAWPLEMEMELHEHLWRFAKTKGAKLRIVFHEPLKASDFENRKVLAKTCHDNVSKGLEFQSALAA